VTSALVPASIELISTWMGGREFELYNDDETWLPHSGCTPVALPCFLVTHKTRPAAINVARAV